MNCENCLTPEQKKAIKAILTASRNLIRIYDSVHEEVVPIHQVNMMPLKDAYRTLNSVYK